VRACLSRYYVGSPLNEGDMERVQAAAASMIFILCDFQTRDAGAEDRGNLLFASHVQRAYPGTDFRLMLAGMSTGALSTQVGLDVISAYSVESLKAAMMATSVRCPGFSTLVLNLGLPDLPAPDHIYGSPGWVDAPGGGGGGGVRTGSGGGGGDVGPDGKSLVSDWLREYVQ